MNPHTDPARNAEYVRTNQGGNDMETTTETTTYTLFEVRLSALDRAINRLQANHEATPDDVVALAEKFERYLTPDEGPLPDRG